ncbi:hypothetical protein CR513_18955, partial [Mucuna pruriens]
MWLRRKVTKLLAIGIIYPISDSQWVSLVQVVPKKFGMTVMMNQHDKLENPITVSWMDSPDTFPFDTFAYRCMSFGLCNAPSTFQSCMTSIFSDLL